jgi:hypothetical protein
VPFIIATNGHLWVFFDSIMPAAYEPKIVPVLP